MIKRIGIILLQLLVTGGGLFYVFHDPQKRAQIADALRHSDIRWLALAWVCYGAVEVIATVRWQVLLRIQGICLGWLRAGAIVMIGLFFNMFLPGLVGGDVVRLYFVFKLARGQKTRATLSVAMDRLFGLLSIIFLGGLSLWLRFDWLKSSAASLHITYVALSLLGIGLTFAVFLFFAAGFGRLHKLPKQMPFRKEIVESAEALKLYRAHVWPMVSLFGITVASHVAYYVSFYCAAQSLHGAARSASLVDMFSIMPLVNTVTSLPISLGGVGVRETLFQELLGNLAHMPSALAALAASLGFVVQASWGVIGAATFLLSRKLSAPVK